MNSYTQLFVFSTVLMMNGILGVTKSATIDHRQSMEKTKLGIKALGTGASFFITYKVLQFLKKNEPFGIKSSPYGGISIDLTCIPVGILGISSALLGSALLYSACEQVLKSLTKSQEKKSFIYHWGNIEKNNYYRQKMLING